MADQDLGRVLLTIARSAIGAELGLAPSGIVSDVALAALPALATPAATFVTLMHGGELRGCVGSLEPRRPLGTDVRENALAAAFRDPRFAPLAAGEFEATSIEVSLLSATERLDARVEESLLALLRPGIDGVILAHGPQRATFLPQVWESLAKPSAFVAALKKKAGLPVDFWSPDLDLARYTVTKWAERDFLMSEAGR